MIPEWLQHDVCRGTTSKKKAGAGKDGGTLSRTLQHLWLLLPA